MRHPKITLVNIVLNQNQASTGAEVTFEQLNNPPLGRVLLKMERIGQDKPIQWRQLERLGKIASPYPPDKT